MDQIRTTVEAIAPDLIELRRDLHAHPELSWAEERTTDVIASWMDKFDIAYRRWDGSGLVLERVKRLSAGARPVIAGCFSRVALLRPRCDVKSRMG